MKTPPTAMPATRRFAVLLAFVLCAALFAVAPQFALAADAHAASGTQQFTTGGNETETTTVPAVPSTAATPGQPASGSDILLGCFTSDPDGTNSFYASYDGKNFRKVAETFTGGRFDRGVPYFANHYSQSCPSIMYYKGYFWSLSGWNRNDGQVWVLISYSKDLIHWTHPEGMSIGSPTTMPYVDMSKVGDKGFRNNKFDIVAPEWSVASDGNVYIVVSCGYFSAFHGEALRDQMSAYIAKVNTLSAREGFPDSGNSKYLWPAGLVFNTERPKSLNINARGTDFIDGALYTEGGVDYLAIKKNGQTNQLYKTTTIGNPSSWKLVCGNMTFGYEAPSIAKLNGSYYLFCDRLKGVTADGTRVTSSTNLTRTNAWPAPTNPIFKDANGKVINLDKVRHGTVITLKANTEAWDVVSKLLRGGDTTFHRLWGLSQYDTMQRIIQEGWDNRWGGTVFVATGKGYADALSVSGAAGATRSPLLITDPQNLTAQTRSELQRLKPNRIIVVGGRFAVSDNVINQIKSATGVTPERLKGTKASDTAAVVNKTLLKNSGYATARNTVAILATSLAFKDALSVAPYAYAKQMPIFLVDGMNEISKNTISAMKECGIEQVIVVGGRFAVGQAVIDELADNDITLLERLGGKSEYDTSGAIAQYALDNGMSANTIGVATGKSYPDALCGAALCGKNNTVLVLADSSNTSNIAIARSNKRGINDGYVFGGQNAVGKEVFNALNSSVK